MPVETLAQEINERVVGQMQAQHAGPARLAEFEGEARREALLHIRAHELWVEAGRQGNVLDYVEPARQEET
jgi:hypothetical protein